MDLEIYCHEERIFPTIRVLFKYDTFDKLTFLLSASPVVKNDEREMIDTVILKLVDDYSGESLRDRCGRSGGCPARSNERVKKKLKLRVEKQRTIVNNRVELIINISVLHAPVRLTSGYISRHVRPAQRSPGRSWPSYDNGFSRYTVTTPERAY